LAKILALVSVTRKCIGELYGVMAILQVLF